jgi:hypothetical protein
MSPRLREAFDSEWRLAEAARERGDLATAFHHLERAHILGQRSTRLHVRSHLGMLRIARARRDRGEVIGQLPRIVAATLFSRIWVPTGNTGGANVSALKPMPIPPDLQKILNDPDTRP